MAKRIEDLIVIGNKQLTDDIFVIELVSGEKLPELLPGQFVQVKVENSQSTFLRRPVSIHTVDYAKNSISLLVQIVGPGTATLSKLVAGSALNIIYPLGNHFSMPSEGEKILLAGGGCGVAPLLFLGQYLLLNGFKPEILLGFRNKKRVIEFEKYADMGPVYLTTEDGSMGEKGYITGHPVLSEKRYDRIYCCGPEPMMKAVASYSLEQGTECEVSLENLMACGIGVCLCCVTDTVRGHVCTCTDGPVFNVKDLKW